MNDLDLGPLYGTLGGLLVDHVGSEAGRVLLYAEAQPAWLSYALFEDRGTHIQNLDCGIEVVDAISEAWYAEEEKKRWRLMLFSIQGERFHAKFFYPEQIDWTEDDDDRRERLVQGVLGQKPIVYPPPDVSDGWSLSE